MINFDPNPDCKHLYEYIGMGPKMSGARHRQNLYSKFKCRRCSLRMEIKRETLRALVKGEAKQLRRSRIRYPKPRSRRLSNSFAE